MSQSIARAHYDENKYRIYQTDEIFVKIKGQIKPQKPPKYFDRLFKDENPFRLEELKIDRVKALERGNAEKLEKTDLSEVEYREMLNRKKEEQIKALKRTL